MTTVKASRGGWIKRKPAPGTKLKALWKDPTWKAEQVARIEAGKAPDCMAAHKAERKLDPEKFSRGLIPNGMTRETAAPLWADARLKADRFIKKMQDEGILPTVLIPDSDEAKAVAALHEVTVLALGPGEKQLKLAAARTVLEYTKSKPESKSKISINAAEQWLSAVAEDNT